MQLSIIINLDGSKTSAIALPEQNDTVAAGTVGHIAGWGLTQNINEPDNILRSVDVTVMEDKACREIWDSKLTVTDRMFCAYAEQKAPCIVM